MSIRKKIYFISDIHLAFTGTSEETAKVEHLLGFLRMVGADEQAHTLYLAGDIFDFWFEWRHVVPKYWFPVLFQLRKLVEQGIEVIFITGNHDFYTGGPGGYLETSIGLRCFAETHEFQVGALRFVIAHGDGLARRDWGYRLLKRLIRHRASIFLYKTLISPEWGMRIAKWFSKSSRKLIAIDRRAWAGEYFEYAQTRFEQGVDCFITGHIHYPIMKSVGNKVFISLGDWITGFTYALFDGERISLLQWRGPENPPAPVEIK